MSPTELPTPRAEPGRRREEGRSGRRREEEEPGHPGDRVDGAASAEGVGQFGCRDLNCHRHGVGGGVGGEG